MSKMSFAANRSPASGPPGAPARATWVSRQNAPHGSSGGAVPPSDAVSEVICYLAMVMSQAPENGVRVGFPVQWHEPGEERENPL